MKGAAPAITETSIASPPQRSTDDLRLPRIDRHVWLVLLVSACVIFPRSFLIKQAHTEYFDDPFHVRKGLYYLTHLHQTTWDDHPPLGQMIGALPMFVTGCWPKEPINPATWGAPMQYLVANEPDQPVHEFKVPRVQPFRSGMLYGHWLRPETILQLIAAWKCLLLLPCLGLTFQWVRALYGLGPAWLATAMVLIDPTVTSQTPTPAFDVISAESILLASLLIWRYFAAPSTRRIVWAAVAVAMAMSIKHTAIIMPAFVALIGFLQWVVRPWWRREIGRREWWSRVRPRLNALGLGAIVTCAAIWAFTLFDISAPNEYFRAATPSIRIHFSWFTELLYRAAEVPWPAGSYLGSIVEAVHHNRGGHPALLFGEKSQLGWWYYFPAVAIYKVPMGFWPVLLLGLVSLAWRRPRWAEVSLLAPAVVWSLLLLTSHINIGFRHALPAYIPWMMLAARCVAPAMAPAWNAFRLAVAWAGVGFASVHVLSYHPDYLSYVNFPRLRAGSADKPYWAINDSNIDWGQGLKQIKAWLDAHPHPGRKVYLGLTPSSPWQASVPQSVSYYVGADRVVMLRADLPAPTDGLLILSPVWEYGVYEDGNRYGFLKNVPPIDVIGHCTPVYDLDALKAALQAAQPSSRPAQ